LKISNCLFLQIQKGGSAPIFFSFSLELNFVQQHPFLKKIPRTQLKELKVMASRKSQANFWPIFSPMKSKTFDCYNCVKCVRIFYFYFWWPNSYVADCKTCNTSEEVISSESLLDLLIRMINISFLYFISRFYSISRFGSRLADYKTLL